MSKYTTTIYNLKQMNFDFGLQDYPIFDEAYRTTLNNEILDFYLTAEIGFETPALFKHYLNSTMRLIMPKYNAMYVAQTRLAENPLGNVDLTETSTREKEIDTTTQSTANGQGTTESNSTANGKNLFQDTPQGQLSSTDLDNQKWATNLTLNRNSIDDESTTTTTNTVNGNENKDSVEEYTRHLIGNNGRKYNVEIYAKLVNEFKNIDQLIIGELRDCFMGIY